MIISFYMQLQWEINIMEEKQIPQGDEAKNITETTTNFSLKKK